MQRNIKTPKYYQFKFIFSFFVTIQVCQIYSKKVIQLDFVVSLYTKLKYERYLDSYIDSILRME